MQHYQNRRSTKAKKPAQANKALQAKFPPSSDSNDVIQAKIGFEIELLGSKILRDKQQARETASARFFKDYKTLATEEPFRGNRLICRYPHFELQSDGFTGDFPYLEIVTEAFEENREGFLLMGETIADIQKLLLEMQSEQASEAYDFVEFKNRGIQEEKDAVIRFPSQLLAYFQATVGLHLSKIPHLFELLSKVGHQENNDQRRRRLKGRRFLMNTNSSMSNNIDRVHDQIDLSMGRAKEFANNYAQKNKCSEELKGLVLMMYFYILCARFNTYTFAKNSAPLLLKTDFATVFDSTPESDYLKLDPEKWLKYFADGCFSEEDLAAPFFSGCNLKGAENLKKLSVKDWVVNIAKGKDLLTRKNCPDPDMARMLLGMGDRGEQVDHDGISPKQIMEFRKMKVHLPIDDWLFFSKDVFKFIYALNHGIDKTFGEDFDLPE